MSRDELTENWTPERVALQGWALASTELERAHRDMLLARQRMHDAERRGARNYLINNGPTIVTFNGGRSVEVRQDSGGMYTLEINER